MSVLSTFLVSASRKSEPSIKGSDERPSLESRTTEEQKMICVWSMVSCNSRSSHRLIWGLGRAGWVEGRESQWRPTRIPQLPGSRKRCVDLARLHLNDHFHPKPDCWLLLLLDARFSLKAARADLRLRSDVAATLPLALVGWTFNEQWWKIFGKYNSICSPATLWWRWARRCRPSPRSEAILSHWWSAVQVSKSCNLELPSRRPWGDWLWSETKRLKMCSVPTDELICEYVEGGGFDWLIQSCGLVGGSEGGREGGSREALARPLHHQSRCCSSPVFLALTLHTLRIQPPSSLSHYQDGP